MQCRKHINIRLKSKTMLDQKNLLVPCGQCMNCRINKRDSWTSRILLESLDATSSAFWTLTFSDEGIETLAEKGPRLLVRNFLNAVRMKEARAMNPAQLRSFGVLEYGEYTFRPHVHIILWNIASTWLDPMPYKPGMPRPILHSKQWPHGHVDVQDLTTSSARYVAKYCCKIEDPDAEPPTIFYPMKPKLGSRGLDMYLESLSTGPLRNEELQPTIRLDGKKFPVPTALRDQFFRTSRRLGLKMPSNNIATRYIDAINLREVGTGKPWKTTQQELNSERLRDALYDQTRESKARSVAAALQKASKRASRSASSSDS